MAHFAKINSDNEVLTVLYVDDANANTEAEGQNYLETHDSWPAAQWIKCSYNTVGGTHKTGGTPFRGNYPSIGYIWDPTNNIFHEPQPFPSYTLNTTTGLWEAPIPKPNTTYTRSDNITVSRIYNWDEDAYQADNSTGWVDITVY